MNKRLVIVLMVVAVILTALPVNVVAQESDPEAMMAVVDRYIHELWTGWQFDIADEIIADDFVVYVWPGFDGMDWDTYFANIIEPTPTNQPDFNFDPKFMFVDGDYVVVGEYWGGKVNADLPVVDDDERSNGLDIYHIVDGKIAELWITYDTMSYMQQVGAVPTEGEVPQDVPWDIALGETSTTPEENKAIVAEMTQNVADHDMDAYFAHFTEDAVVHDQGADLTRDEAKEMMISIQGAWPDHHAEDVSYYAAGDLTVIMFKLVFKENEVEFPAVNIDRFEDGQVAEEWWVYDSYTFTQLLEPPAEAEQATSQFPTGVFRTECAYMGVTYECEMALNSDGSFTYSVDGEVGASGTYRIEGDQLIWVTDDSCEDVPMTYTWSYEENVLTMYEVGFDPCPNRRWAVNDVPHEKMNN